MPSNRNYEYFKRQLPTLLQNHKGQFVLIRNEQEIAYYPNLEEALKDAYQRYQDNDFIIQEITDEDRVNYINSSFLIE